MSIPTRVPSSSLQIHHILCGGLRVAPTPPLAGSPPPIAGSPGCPPARRRSPPWPLALLDNCKKISLFWQVPAKSIAVSSKKITNTVSALATQQKNQREHHLAGGSNPMSQFQQRKMQVPAKINYSKNTSVPAKNSTCRFQQKMLLVEAKTTDRSSIPVARFQHGHHPR